MRLNINLATQPYQDLRRYVLRWGLPVLLFALVSAWLCWYAVNSWMQSRDVTAQITRVQAEIKSMDQERAQAQALLARPENRTVVEQSRQLNQLIAQKAFSWTSVFMQLENIMPSQLRVVQLSPELNQQNQLQLRLVVSGNSHDQALELVRRLEKSPNFARPELKTETTLPEGVQFDISAIYIPHTAEATKDENDKAEKKVTAAPETVNSAASVAGKAGRR